MFDNVNVVQLTVFTLLFVAVSVLGFLAARWRRADDLEHLDEWVSAAETSGRGSPGS